MGVDYNGQWANHDGQESKVSTLAHIKIKLYQKTFTINQPKLQKYIKA